MTFSRMTQALDEQLIRQADLLRRGDLSGALALTAGIDRLVTALARTAPPPDTPQARASLAAVETRAARNAELIDAARDGVARARAILTQQQDTGFQGYDARGQRMRIGPQPAQGRRTG